MMTQTIPTMCNHTFCLLPARAYSRMPAAYKVTQVFDNGYKRVTYVCNQDMEVMRGIIKPSDIVEAL